MIQTLDIEPLAEEVMRGLLHPDSSCSFNVIVPPGFGERAVAEGLVARVRQAAPELPIAELTMDEIADGATFVARLAEGLGRPLPTASGPDRALVSLLDHGTPALYVLRRFQCTLDTIPAALLACLRTAEQSGSARAIVLAPASHKLLKRRWEAKGHPLIVSDYGDTHAGRVVRLLDAPALAARANAGAAPAHVRDFVIAATGGYPEPLTKVLAEWRRGGASPVLKPALREFLRREATVALQRLVEWLDHGGEQHFQNYLVDLHHGYRREDALVALQQHELRDLLLANDELRAGSLALAALQRQREQLLQRGDPGGQRLALERARQLYLRGDYASALELLSAGASSPTAALLRHHATIMRVLTDVEPGLDTEWSALIRAIGEARRWLNQQPGLDETGALARRYDALEQHARMIAAIEGPRVVDRLAEPRPEGGHSGDDVRAALFLLTLHLHHARKRRGHAEALQKVLALPEQLYRVWARWRLGLDYYRAPVIDPELAGAMRRNWRETNELALPTAGMPFPSFWCFALYALARQDESGPHASAPENSWPEMSAALQMLRVRNDPAHSLATITKSQREKFFSLCARWLAAVFVAVPAGAGEVTEDDLLGLLAPLPLLDGGALDWSPAGSRTSVSE